MSFAKFTFEGVQGLVTRDGFVQWRTLSCEIGALIGGLRQAADKAHASLQ